MRLGGPLEGTFDSPEAWIRELKSRGYSAAYSPLELSANDQTVAAYVKAAADANIVIAEVGGWSNPMDPDPGKAKAALTRSQQALDLAERMGANCCVNIVGSLRGDKWDAPHPDSFTAETFERVVDTTRAIIDAVKPERTFYTLETMPWMLPSTIDEYLRLMRAIDRPGLAVHLDPVNMINSPDKAYSNGALMRECFEKLGPYVKSCHAKDIVLTDELTVHLSEVRPGLGVLEYAVFIEEVEKLGVDSPMMLEHLPADQYLPAAQHVRKIAGEAGVRIV